MCWFKIPAQQNNEKAMLALKMGKKGLKALCDAESPTFQWFRSKTNSEIS